MPDAYARAPRHLGAPPLLNNTEKVFQMHGFFLTSDMHNIHFRPRLSPAGGAYDVPPIPYSDAEGVTFPHVPFPSTPSAF